MHRLESDGAVPHAFEPADLLRCLGTGGCALESAAGLLAELCAEAGGAGEGIAGLGGELLAEQRPRNAEGTGCGRHFDLRIGARVCVYQEKEAGVDARMNEGVGGEGIGVERLLAKSLSCGSGRIASFSI